MEHRCVQPMNCAQSMIFTAKLFVIILSLSGMFLIHDCKWLVETKEKLAYLIDFDKNEAENGELEIEVDKFLKDQNHALDRQPAFMKKWAASHNDVPVSLYPDVTTPPPEMT